MKKIVKKIALMFYYGLAKHLPNYSMPGGKIFNWLRVLLLKKIIPIGSHCRIMKNVYIGNGNNILIGSHCRINEDVRLDNVQIGNHVMIARESVVLGKMHEFSESTMPMVQQGSKKTILTIIEDDVWLGLRVVVMPGVKIKKGSIIGACAVVTKDTEEYGVYGGIPATLLKSRK